VVSPLVIPERSASRYAGHYSFSVDAQRLLEILADSVRLALGSKNPVTAQDRFQLAVELYYQLMSLGLPQELRSSVERTVADMAERFPLQMRVNEALGLHEKASKLKTPRRRLELLYRSRDILRDALAANPGGSDAFRSVQAQVFAGISEAEASEGKGSA
jgi:hypothetical protein